ncbi:trichohyalin-like [Procambarus clarkii]|uniref:trichohyalin-like n=1 Tax=Procambarus clarkii TaxID=6728 RepID=UPI0037449313
MEDDKVARFIDTRDEQVLEDCTKAQLQSIADHFGIKLRSSKVGERRLEILAQLRARDEALGEERPQTPASVGEHLSIGGSSRGSSGSRCSVKLEILKLQLEAQLRKEEREQETQLRREERGAEAQLKREEREAQLHKEEREAQLRKEEREAQL